MYDDDAIVTISVVLSIHNPTRLKFVAELKFAYCEILVRFEQ